MSAPITSSCVSVRNWEVEVRSGSITCGWTAATPGTREISAIFAARSSPPAVKPAPIPIPSPATEIWPRTKRSPPSMTRPIRSAIAPSVTRPATPTAMPSTVNRYPFGSSARSLTGSCRSRTPASPLQAGFDRTTVTTSAPAIDAHDDEERLERQAHPERRADEGTAGQHGEDTVLDTGHVLRTEEDLQERGLVVLTDESPEGGRAAMEAPRVGRETVRFEPRRREGARNLGGCHFGGLHGDVDAGREDRIHEGDGVADAEESITRGGLHLVREIGSRVHGRDAFRAVEPLADAFAAPHHPFEQIGRRALALPRRPRVHHASDAGHVPRERDPPEPAVLEDVDPDVALVFARPAPRAAEVREEGHLPEAGHRAPPPEARRQKGVAATGVDQEAPADLPRRSVLAHADRHAIPVEPDVLDGRRLQDRDARLAPGVIEQELVEVGARHLEAVGRPRLPVAKVEHALEPGLLVVEERAALGDETACAKLVEHPQSFEQRHVGGKQ